MSIPSSSEEVATRHGSCPDFSSSSTTVRSSWERDPWWARAISTWAAEGPRASPAVVRGVLSATPHAPVAGQLLLGFAVRQLVQALGEALGGAAVVDEDDRRGVFLDQLQQLRVDRRPDRADVGEGLALGGDAVGAGEGGSARVGHVLDRDDDLQVELLRSGRRRRSCTRASGPTRNCAIRSSGRWVAERPIRWTGSGGSEPPRVAPSRRSEAAPGSAPGASPASTGRRRGSRRRSPPRPW